MQRLTRLLAYSLCCAPLLHAATSAAHGIVGDRFFPATISTDDPFAVDELSLGASYTKGPGDDGDPAAREIDAGFEFDKEILPHFTIGVEETFIRTKPAGEHGSRGFDNVGVTLKYEVWQNDAHEAIVAVGLDSDLGGTGSNSIGESFTTFTPAIYFGKGMGDLPDSVGVIRPVAVTGVLGNTLPTEAEPNAFVWEFALEYSLPCLQQHVKDVGLPEPLKNMIPLVEFSFQTPENRDGGKTSGTINPGVLWETTYCQLGVEAIIPVNRDSGSTVGLAVNLQIYIDDLAPSIFGHPIFGAR